MNDGTPPREGVEPALTPEEWDRLSPPYNRPRTTTDVYARMPRDLRQMSALSLQGAGPGGEPLFTREDVGLLKMRVEPHMATEVEPRRDSPTWAHWNTQRRWRSLVARLESLLPPDPAGR